LSVVAYVRTVRTASGATAVQIVHSSRRGARDIEHIGSAHDEAELEALKEAARQRMAAGQTQLDLGLDVPADPAQPLPITSTRMGHLSDALSHAYQVLGFAAATGGDEVFRAVVLARIIEPTSKLDSLRVVDEAGIPPSSYATHFETDTGDGFREPGYSKERRLEPQITIGLLTDAAGFPLMVEAFEGNKAEMLTMLPTIQSFMDTHQLIDVTVVADAGMLSAASQKAIEEAGLSFISESN
jgi:hypothetical protein